MQSLLLEGGPTLAAAFLEADLVDKLLLFVAPTLAGVGPSVLAALPSPRTLSRLRPRRSATTCFSKRMSTSPDTQRADDQLVTHLSHWLTRQLGNDELRRKVEQIGTDELAPAGREAVRELLAELGTAVPGERGQLEVLVRETVETLVYGD